MLKNNSTVINIKMIRLNLIRKLVPIRTSYRNKSDSAINIEKLEQESATTFDVIDEEAKVREEEIQRKRNKSRLKPEHYNVVHGKVPSEEPTHWYQGTLKYARKMYGRYGEASGVDPSLCWPTKDEISAKIDYERVAYPFTIPQMIESVKQKRQEKEERIQTRQQDIIRKMEKLEQWKKELFNKIAKKESEALTAKERKDRLVEEVRRHFGYTVDPRDEKFKEMLEKKEKEQKKAMKLERKKAKEEKMIASLLNKSAEESETQKGVTNKQTQGNSGKN